MTELKTKRNKIPTRKILAVIIAGAVVGGLQSGLQLLWPDHPFAPLMEDLDFWVQMGVMFIAGVLTRSDNDKVSE